MTPPKPLALLALCGALLLAGCVHPPTDGQKAAQRAVQPPQTATQTTTTTRTCEGPCTPTHTSATTGSATATASSASTSTPRDAPAPTAPSTLTTYSRDAFGTGWADPDHNGCDARQDATARAVTHVDTRTSRCQITTGTIHDTYSDRDYPAAATRDFDVDHVVALADAWRSGASTWTPTRRRAFANDPAELILTTAHTNRSKSDQGPDTWAPTSHTGACWYAARYAAVKYLWGLTPDPDHAEAERAAIETTLAGCTGTEGR
jgi:uncharacterized low-complexity protein